MHSFADRTVAGRDLALAVGRLGVTDPVVLALPRGGVPVAAEVARALSAPIDLVMVRKIGLPSWPELAAGAVVNGDSPQIVVNDAIARSAGLTPADVNRLAAPHLTEIRRRRDVYLAGRPHESLAGRTAIVVDDGIATGATMRAAVLAVRKQGPSRLILAVPVAARDSLAGLADLVDDVVCLRVPTEFIAVGAHYDSFDQVSDDQVTAILQGLWHPPNGSEG